MSFNFVDRKSTYPNRYKITKSDGSTEYVTLTRADEPTEVGTPLNRDTFDAMIRERIVRSGGKNLFDADELAGSNANVIVEQTGNDIHVYSKVAGTNHVAQTPFKTLKAGVTYTISANVNYVSGIRVSFGFRDSNNKFVSKVDPYITSSGKYSVSITPDVDTEYRYAFMITGGTSEIGNVTFSDIMVEVGSPATEYEPHYSGLNELTEMVNALLGVTG